MLFLYRPRETWMPFARPMSRTNQAAYNRSLQTKFEASRRVRPSVAVDRQPVPVERPDPVKQLGELAQLHRAGALTDAEFAAAKAKVLG